MVLGAGGWGGAWEGEGVEEFGKHRRGVRQGGIRLFGFRERCALQRDQLCQRLRQRRAQGRGGRGWGGGRGGEVRWQRRRQHPRP